MSEYRPSQAPGTMTAGGAGALPLLLPRRRRWRRSEVEVLGPKREPGYAEGERGGGRRGRVGGKTRRWRKRLEEEVARPRVAPAR